MDYKKDALILIEALKKYRFTKEEKEALDNAIGLLVWAATSQKMIQDMKSRRANA